MKPALSFDWSNFSESYYQHLQEQLQTRTLADSWKEARPHTRSLPNASHDVLQGTIGVNDARFSPCLIPGLTPEESRLACRIYFPTTLDALHAPFSVGPFRYSEDLFTFPDPCTKTLTQAMLLGTASYPEFQKQFEANVTRACLSQEKQPTANPELLRALATLTNFWEHVADCQMHPQNYGPPSCHFVYEELFAMVQDFQRRGVSLAQIGTALKNSGKDILEQRSFSLHSRS